MRLEEATVLVVDDEPDLREIFSGWLGRKGCRVLTAPNGAEALEILARETVHVLLSDIRMPVMGGVALVREIFDRKLFIPSIIFVSGFGDVEPREMYGLGVELLMEKPLNRTDLLRALRESLLPREERWQVPLETRPSQTLRMELPSLQAALGTGELQMGRGGCALLSWEPLAEEQTVGLAVQFAREAAHLTAQGTVRWYGKEDGYAGISFEYLAPESRAWVLEAMGEEEARRSFIPQGRPRTARMANDAHAAGKEVAAEREGGAARKAG